MRIPETVRTAISQDGAVLMDISQGQMFSANPIGSRIWQQLNNDRSPEEIAEEFVADFGISREQALSDVNQFVQQLEARQLIRRAESSDVPDNFNVASKGLLRRLLRWRKPRACQCIISRTEATGNTGLR